ncbi:leucine-rich repeat domain-containing protein [bacterium]|nr:leucine-rich repeat domain-containing protein [bacterium]
MKKGLNLLVVLLVFLVFSCSSSHSPNDSDMIPDSDTDTHDSEIQDDDFDSQGSEFVEDSDKTPDFDSDLEEPVPNDDEEEDEEDDEDEEIDDTDRINGYKRCYNETPDEPYEGLFADPKLESQIKQILGYDEDYELKEEDLEKITEIGFSTKDLRGVEKLVNLEYAKFSGENVYNFTPLADLKNLKKVRIYSEKMTCLDGSFSFLTSLETLEIEETKLKDVSPIEQLINLKSLELSYNQIEFLPKNLGNLQKLEWLVFSGNKVENIKPLKLLINLKELFFYDNYVEDISPLKDLANLIRLGCDGNNIKDISAVTNLVNLTYLSLNQNQIKAIPKEFANLKKLQTCELDYNNISKLPDLEGLDSLVTMRLSSNDLNDADLIKLDGLGSVKFLYVALNKFTKVSIMKNLKSLKELYLNYNSITDLSGFADNESFPALKKLDVGSNKIENVEAFRNRKGLSSLWIDKNCIKDFSPLEELKERGTYVGGMNEQLESCDDTGE